MEWKISGNWIYQNNHEWMKLFYLNNLIESNSYNNFVISLYQKKVFYFSSFLQRAKTFSKLAMEIFSQINVFTEFKSRYLRALQILIYILN